MKAVVILNPTSGKVDADLRKQEKEEIAKVFAEHDVVADVMDVEPADLARFLKELANSDYDCVVAGGGDGTVSAAAAALASTDKVLGVLPLGTLNHFAKDLKIPLSLKEAVRVIATAKMHQIDLVEVNGLLFINNSSVGIYPQVVQERDYQILVWGTNKWIAMFRAAIRIFLRFPLLTIRIDTPENSTIRRTPILFVGNNRYDIDLITLRNRASLDRGELCVYILKPTGRWEILKTFVRALFGRLNQMRDFDSLYPNELRVETEKPSLSVAIDGEVRRMESPLHYKIRPKILKVFLPHDGQQ